MGDLEILNSMASRFQDEIEEPDSETLQRWRNLFSLSEPYETIMDFRNRFDIVEISDAHWAEVQAEMASQGHDRETYTYKLTTQRAVTKARKRARRSAPARGMYLLQLLPACSAISSPEAVKRTAKLSTLPLVQQDEKSEAKFVSISAESKDNIEEILDAEFPDAQPTFIRLSLPAPKDLDPYSIYPYLGLDPTLPHHRASSTTTQVDLVQQYKFPVYYFFYGTLADEKILRKVLKWGDNTPVEYLQAFVRNARLTAWGGKYKALVDGDEKVLGSTIYVSNECEEEMLRTYETDHYEVVRCKIEFSNGHFLDGLTFRFVGYWKNHKALQRNICPIRNIFRDPSKKNMDSRQFGILLSEAPTKISAANGEKIYFVHPKVLEKYENSALKPLISPAWKNGEDRIIDLNEHDSEVVDCLVQYMYTGEYQVPTEAGDELNLSPELGAEPTHSPLPNRSPLLLHARVYSLGHKFLLEELVEQAEWSIEQELYRNDAWREDFASRFFETVEEIYNTTSGRISQPVRKVLCKWASFHFDELFREDDILKDDGFPHLLSKGGDFAIDLCRALAFRNLDE